MQFTPLGCILSRRCSAASTKAAASCGKSFAGLGVCVRLERKNLWRHFSVDTGAVGGGRPSGERLRIAVVGGGAAGLSTALHLAPLVTAGLIGGPIDVFEAGERQSSSIGVGIWSTALYAFRDSKDVESHQIVFDDMFRKGTLSEKVGFRSPRGDWLAESNLAGDKTPDFLFLRESDMLGALRKGIDHEVQRGRVVVHSGPSGRIDSIAEDSPEPWSAPLLVRSDGPENNPPEPTERDYHLIVAADGMNSVLRKTYGGHVAKRRRRFLGTGAMGNESDGLLDLPGDGTTEDRWDVRTHSEATNIQDRHYHVFRGNSTVTRDEVEGLENAFQTWGESCNMRFATVPMEFPLPGGKTRELHTWFITIDDESISSEADPERRKEKLLGAFADWHDPIRQLVGATPAAEISMERAVAHVHSCEPVVNFRRVVEQMRGVPFPSGSRGPVVQFVGDAFMTVDPILAQGFTIGMEGAAALAESLERCLRQDLGGATGPPLGQGSGGRLAFSPRLVRKELLDRHDRRMDRLICLLRSSELVQALGQPTKGSLSGWISRWLVRPAMRLAPGFAKTPFFNRVMEYSLGLHTGGQNK